MSGGTRKMPWEVYKNGSNPFSAGSADSGWTSPFGQTPTPYQGNQDIFNASRDNVQMGAKANAMGLTPPSEGLGTKLWHGALGTLGWLGTQIDRPFNAVEGALEESVKGRLNRASQSQPDSFFSTNPLSDMLRGAGRGFAQKENYDLGRGISNLISNDPVTTPYNQRRSALDTTLWGKQLQGASGPQTDPNLSGFKHSTFGDALSLLFNVKGADWLPVPKLTRTVVPGATEVTQPGRAFKLGNQADTQLKSIYDTVAKQPVDMVNRGVNNVNQARKLLTQEFGASSGEVSKLGKQGMFSLAQDVIGSKPLPSLMDRVSQEAVSRGTPLERLLGSIDKAPRQQLTDAASRSYMKYAAGIGERPQTLDRFAPMGKPLEPIVKQGDATLQKVLGVKNPFGEAWTPFKDQQIAAFDKVGQGAKKALSYAPPLESFLSSLSTGVESTKTEGAKLMAKIFQGSRAGAQAASHNLNERLSSTVKFAGKLTGNEDRALYYGITMGQSFSDPAFLQQLESKVGIPAAEIQKASPKLETIRNWWQYEQQKFASTGEYKGYFKPMTTEYLPIFVNKDSKLAQLGAAQGHNLSQEFGGLRSIQKMRNFDTGTLLDHANQLQTDSFQEAVKRYGKMFANLDKRQNVLDQLQQAGHVVTKDTPGFTPLADVLKTGSDGTVGAHTYFIKDALKNKFADEVLGAFGGGRGIQGLRKLGRTLEPWKASLTSLNPFAIYGNAVDDAVRNHALGGVGAQDLAQAVTRETGSVVKGVKVPDWSKNTFGQWEYTPGSRSTMNLTPKDLSNLSRASGVSFNATADMAHSEGKNAISKLLAHARNKSEQVQGVQREANFISNTKKYGDTGLASKVTGQDLIDYRNTTPFQRDVLRPFFPFSTFALKNPGVAASQMAMNPEVFAKFHNIQQQANHGQDNHLPDYMAQKPVISWKEGDQTKVLNPNLSQYDARKLLPSNWLEEIRHGMGPFLSIPQGLMSGRDGLGRDLTGVQPSGFVDSLFGQRGVDGKKFTDAKTKFVIDSLFASLNNDARGVAEPGKFVGLRSFDSNKLLRGSILDKNKALQDLLKKAAQMGYRVPKYSEIKPTPSPL